MAEENRWGTVFMGPSSARESRLDKIANREEQDLWNRRTEAEYLRRVKERAVEQLNAMLAEAQEQAADLLAAAQTDADNIRQAAENLREEARQDRETAAAELENARDIRARAHDEGYDRGVEQAMLELEEQRGAIDATTLAVLKAIEDQCGTLFASWRDELAALLRQCVETATGWILDEERAAILENLLCKSIETLENQRRISVRANPVDVPAVEAVLDSVRSRFHDLTAWEVKSDETLEPGGLVVESVSGRVEARTENRREIVEQTLRHLTLPESDADTAAMAEIHAVGERSGMPALEQAVFAAEQKAIEEEERLAREEAARQAEEAALAAQQAADGDDTQEMLDGDVMPAEADDADTGSVQAAPPHRDISDLENLPIPPRPTPRNPALAALPEGHAPKEDSEFDKRAKEIARAMMYGDSVPPENSPATELPATPVLAEESGEAVAESIEEAGIDETAAEVAADDTLDDTADDSLEFEDLDTPMSDEELMAGLPPMPPLPDELEDGKPVEAQN